MNKMSISGIKKLRDLTGAGFLDCKEALEVSGLDIDKAIEFLRKKGVSTAHKKKDRTASEGLISIDKTLNIRGASGYLTKLDNTYFKIEADTIELLNLLFENCTSAILVSGEHSGLIIKNVLIDGCTSTAVGFSGGNFDSLLIEDSSFNNNRYGLSFSNSNPDQPFLFSNVTIKRSKFHQNSHKGMFFESLSNALFEDVEVCSCGLGGNQYEHGIDLNLKYADYSNLTFKRIQISGNGAAESSFGDGCGLFIKARDDSIYAAQPATLTNVLIDGGFITGNNIGLSVDSINGITDFVVRNVIFKDNIKEAMGAYYSTEIDGLYNWWGDESGPTSASNPDGKGEVITFSPTIGGDIQFDPWLKVLPFEESVE